ncbi:MAG: S9 family peptidase [Gemmatimonadetes bacterium]|nr:S9 family peptidase [Gemmatimonadota bacterium]NNM07036.1 S9 family peptidase [Gemmatimonadota bacterium]
MRPAERESQRLLVGLSVLAILLVLPIVSPLSAQETPIEDAGQSLQIHDMFRIKRVGAPQVSPEGEWVAYTVSTSSLEPGESGTQVWMVPSEGGEPIPMTAEGYSASSPDWSPDGKYLSFIATRGDSAHAQVWVMDRRMGEGQELTKEKWGISGYVWSPDGSKLLLTIRDPDPVDTLPAHKKPKHTLPWEIDRLQFKQDRVGYITGNRHTHLYVFDLETKTSTQITSGDFDAGSPAWSPDGSKVAFVANRTEDPDGNSNSDIWVVDAANTDQGDDLVQITTNPGSDSSPVWSPDGEWIAYTMLDEPDIIWYEVNDLAMARSDGSGEVRVLTEGLDRNVSSPRFSSDGRHIFFGVEDSAENHVGRVDVRNGRIDRPVAGPLTARGFDLGPKDEVFVSVAKTALPGEIFATGRNGELTQLTHVNEEFLEGIRLGEVVNATFPSADGTEIEGIFYLPPGYEEGLKYPTLLRIHGGPVSQYSLSFNFEAHLFAANGYVVVTTNPRGSSGYGQAFSYDLWAEWGVRDYQDVMAGVDHAIEQGWADPDRLGVGGWSYGGILTDHVITQTDRFKAAITGASEFLYVTNYGHDHYQLQWEKELGLPWENREAWERISPFNKVENITTPTLVMCGEKDWNVPVNNSEQIYQALKRMGRETELVVYPGQGHGLSLPYQVDRYERYLKWYGKYVKQTEAPSDGEGGAR